MSAPSNDTWASGDAYEPYIGRWSRLVAREFLGWLNVPAQARWLDVGCGTGALTETILSIGHPLSVEGVDPSSDYVAYARTHVRDSRATFTVADARSLPQNSGAFDATVSALAINFIPAPEVAVAELARVTRPGGIVAAYVWDYAGGMQLIKRFWTAAASLDPAAEPLDEGKRFPLCEPNALAALWRDAGLAHVESRAIDVPTRFRDFDDYWTPFLGGQGPAPGYAMSLSEERRAELRERIRTSLPIAEDGSVSLVARAWGVRGVTRN